MSNADFYKSRGKRERRLPSVKSLRKMIKNRCPVGIISLLSHNLHLWLLFLYSYQILLESLINAL